MQGESQPGVVGQQVGVRQVSERVWLVTFMYYDLGYFEDETCRPRADRKPVWSNRVTHVSGIIRYPCLRNGPSESGRGDWIRTSDPLRPRRKNPHNWGQRETAAPRFS